MTQEYITEINERTFWKLMETAKSQFGQDRCASAEWLKEELLKLPPAQVLQFHAIMQSYLWAADKYGLWTAASIMCEYGCSDDGFIDFRAWLIYQGKAVYLDALKTPDSLAEIKESGECEFEQLCYIGNGAYIEQTGRSVYKDCTLQMQEENFADILKNIQYSPFIEYPLEFSNSEIVFPKLCEKYLTEERTAYAQNNPLWNTELPELCKLVEEGVTKIENMKKEKHKTGVRSMKHRQEIR